MSSHTGITASDAAALDDSGRRLVLRSLLRGFICRCPRCGKGSMFSSYLKVRDHCDVCGEALYHQQADDAAPYFTIFAVGHIVVGMLMSVELAYSPPMWLHLAIWLPFTVVLSLFLLPRLKGAVVGLQWALRMHGFGDMPAQETEGGNSFALSDRNARA